MYGFFEILGKLQIITPSVTSQVILFMNKKVIAWLLFFKLGSEEKCKNMHTTCSSRRMWQCFMRSIHLQPSVPTPKKATFQATPSMNYCILYFWGLIRYYIKDYAEVNSSYKTILVANE